MQRASSNSQPNYLVYAGSYNENNGGALYMHNLVHTLNSLGEKAFLWPARYPLRHPSFRNWFRREWNFFTKPYFVNPELDTPVASRDDLNNASVVIYPEIILGNPLRARNVVRWLLYNPKLHTHYRFGPDEMFFRVGEFCDVPELTGGAPDLFMWTVNRVYRNEHRPDRKGVCYMLRKGKNKPRIPETEVESAIQVDGLSHAELNEVFNRCDTFYSYDEATMYSQYAALCGCLSVVVPGLFGSRAEWVQNHKLASLGVAYGTSPEELEHARMSRDKVREMLQQQENESVESVRRFVSMTQARFGAAA
ncbi:MAG: hypothetical protein RL756_2298 [Pseudomonadota bacterium]